jgi:hypothetical protein
MACPLVSFSTIWITVGREIAVSVAWIRNRVGRLAQFSVSHLIDDDAPCSECAPLTREAELVPQERLT